ncbi:hypothetical protein BHAOGJBA_6381 [Methylobacterium hispanicum]|uniref:Secreted protein n=1 Tax=Methylobacterium hispanicum TaxID=270350 RepID=A0AAV4ZXL6_9HYPH|nr:hypothetical protein BHAOGJBA_6381 [Methylobacterium hispanicum]
MLASAARLTGSCATPNSPRNRRLPVASAHWVTAVSRSTPMFAETTLACVPELSLSRYWCTSKAKLPSGSRMPGPITVSLSVLTQLWAPVQ